MSSASRRGIALGVACLAAIPAIGIAAAATNRTVYVSVTDGKGNAVADLTEPDFARRNVDG